MVHSSSSCCSLPCLLTLLLAWIFSLSESRILDDETHRRKTLPLQKEHSPPPPDDTQIAYTTPGSPLWPSDSLWSTELGDLLSPGAELLRIHDPKNTYDDYCVDIQPDDPIHPVCMVHNDCAFQFCHLEEEENYNLPAYVVSVRTVQDIQLALDFAERYNIPVSIKTSGHNFAGSSTLKDSLNIYMADFPKDGTILNDFQDSCGNTYSAVVGVNGGEDWGDVASAVGKDYHFVSGDTLSVSAAGGWLQGGGLSETSRRYGLGIDNVVRFELVLPNATLAVADRCQNPDLFWALRGGGGGTYGIVTHVQYRLYPRTRITVVGCELYDIGPVATRLFLEFWAKVSVNTTSQHVGGGYFASSGFDVIMLGDYSVAVREFFWGAVKWMNEVFRPAGFNGYCYAEKFDSWYEYIGGGPKIRKKTRRRAKRMYDPNQRRGMMHGSSISSRLVPYSLIKNPSLRNDLIDFLVKLSTEVESFESYWLGGAVMDAPPEDSAIHPVARNSMWAITTTTREGARRVRKFLPNSVSGSSFNHHSVTEPMWRESLWGTEHYRTLLELKNKYDPDRRLNCWHCVGYQGPELEDDEEP